MTSIALMAVAFGLAFVTLRADEIGRLRLGAVDVAFALFIFVKVCVELANASDLNHSFYSATLLIPVASYVAFLLARQSSPSLRHAVQLLRWISIPAAGVALLAALQVARAPLAAQFISNFVSAEGYERRLELGWAIRGTSTIGHHTALGGYFVCMTTIVCLDLLISNKLQKRLPVTPLVLLPVVLVGQLTSLTFATIALSAIITLVTLVLLGLRPGIVVTLGVVTFAAWRLFGAELESRLDSQTIGAANQQYSWLPETISYRMGIWTRETIPAIAERPLTGWGIDVYAGVSKGWPVFPTQLSWGSPESEYLRTLISGGLLALCAQLALFITAAAVIVALWRGLSGAIATPVAVMFGGLLLISLLHSHFNNPGVPYPFWLIVGACAGLAAATNQEKLRTELKNGLLSPPSGQK
ncbi:hypothetical protein [Microbacterium sp. NPDC076911]|uniref:hypothetical protein n=1 Tax=Microbacterium sp. NPDC076911 TaxID=3154958 RepID=UPI00341B6F7B